MLRKEIKVHSGIHHPQNKLADLHIHTDQTDGWLTESYLMNNIQRRGLSAIAMTDHDRVQTGYDLREAFARTGRPEEVVMGSEITAKKRNGDDVHIIGLFLEDDVKKFQSERKTVDDILKQGGMVVFPHPVNPSRRVSSADAEVIIDIAKDGVPVLIETFNGSLHTLRWAFRLRGLGEPNNNARSFHRDNRDIFLGEVGGTDSHYRTFGRGMTSYDGDLRSSLERGETAVVYRNEREKARISDLRKHQEQLRDRDVRRREEEISTAMVEPQGEFAA